MVLPQIEKLLKEQKTAEKAYKAAQEHSDSVAEALWYAEMRRIAGEITRLSPPSPLKRPKQGTTKG